MTPPRVAWALLMALTGPACLDPLVSDEVPVGDLLLPAGSAVPSASGALARQIAANDQADAFVPLRSAFAGGRSIHFWDFGVVSRVAAPIWVIVKDDPAGSLLADDRVFAPVGQPNVIDAVPGDPAYSPFWSLHLVPVTDRWDGEIFASAAAISAGVDEGLLETPLPLPRAINCPVVAPDTRLDRGAALAPESPDPGYYRGVMVTYFAFGAAPVDAARQVATAPAYHLRREGGEPLDEAVRGVDMTGDGDRLDTNDLFAAAPGDGVYTGLVTPIDVVVRAGYPSIDTSGDDAIAGLMDAAALFITPEVADPSWVVAVYPRDGVENRPIQRAQEGAQ